jgi:hypothetical protein
MDNNQPGLSALFPLGRLMATPGALAALEASGDNPLAVVTRHVCLEPGALDPEDQAANRRAVARGGRILSAYCLIDGTKVWVITEADRSSTTILLPDEY